MAARFLRLAFRVNMEQLKLVEQEAPPLPAPLTAEQLADEEQRDAAVSEEFAAAERRSEEQAAEWERPAEADQTAPLADVVRGSPDLAQDMTAGLPDPNQGDLRSDVSAGSGDLRRTVVAGESMHKVHHADAKNSGASDDATEVCAAATADEKRLADSCRAGIETGTPDPDALC